MTISILSATCLLVCCLELCRAKDVQSAYYFKKMTDPVTRSPQCASNQPSFEQHGRSSIVCAGQCAEKLYCMGFNYILDLKYCQLFLNQPSSSPSNAKLLLLLPGK